MCFICVAKSVLVRNAASPHLHRLRCGHSRQATSHFRCEFKALKILITLYCLLLDGEVVNIINAACQMIILTLSLLLFPASLNSVIYLNINLLINYEGTVFPYLSSLCDSSVHMQRS